jgi:hypothetical protein
VSVHTQSHSVIRLAVFGQSLMAASGQIQIQMAASRRTQFWNPAGAVSSW